MKTVLVGFGDIAEKHLAVLSELKCEVIGVIGRDYNKTLKKSKEFKIPNVYDKLEKIPFEDCDFIMNLTSPDMVSKTLGKLIPYKKPIFTEKPVGFGIKEIENNILENKKFQIPIMVGTNRRFYSIFHESLKFLKNNKKTINSLEIDAPENLKFLKMKKFNKNIKDNWMYANSIHSVDLIRFFGGDVTEINVKTDKKKLNFYAVGKCQNKINFIYKSNWEKTTKWKITIKADDINIIFSPLEFGKILINGKEEKINPSDVDLEFKPGFYSQFQHFLEYVVQKNMNKWPASNLDDHKKSLHLVEQIFMTNNNS